jgi:hypothetical protein
MQISNKSTHSVIKTLLIIFLVAVTAMFVSKFLPAFREGYADKDKLKLSAVAEDDPDLKCPAISSKGCTPADVMKLGYDIASDPALSQVELQNFKKVCQSRSPGHKMMADQFIGDVTLLKFATMLNTKPNEAEIQKKIDEMAKATNFPCYTYEFMFEMAGLQVGTADQKTLSKVQSEAVRCYAQRFNAFRQCMGLCKK